MFQNKKAKISGELRQKIKDLHNSTFEKAVRLLKEQDELFEDIIPDPVARHAAISAAFKNISNSIDKTYESIYRPQS